ncbi:hypothetical protein JR316_0009614 [Psilocybe cubensis]|uniref:Uncharacterized protein n=2 Tax=Psilocybe cubensis TaxID=181762 RepID=A0ACB8GQB3_PSICU|nr:hypothetical protein JR316_0009614 [Psilocybe cubensis]KAH9477401.1 hypothetical protein JR316_0009614 [Psilocybe cubensis]
MELPTLKITFPFEPGEPYDNEERFTFWDSPDTIQWFKLKGYHLYRRIYLGWDPEGLELEPTETMGPTLPPDSNEEFIEAEYPYAYHDMTTTDAPDENYNVPLRVIESTGKVVFAQDSCKRHVAIKLVRDDTDEYRILRFLSQQDQKALRDNCILPVLDLLPIEGFWFAIMPRWGTDIYEPAPGILKEVVDIMHSWLKRREGLRHGGKILYGLYDYDFSVMLPAGVDRRDFRLPYDRSWGTFNIVYDTAGGECDYDPFAFDVGILGATLCKYHQHLAPVLPLLAPLLDKMTTWDIINRFTASEALQFFEERLAEFPEQLLEVGIPEEMITGKYTTCNRWENIPCNVVEKWKCYKTPPVSWRLRILRALYRLTATRCPHLMPKTCLFFIRTKSLIAHAYRSIFPSKIAT